MERSKVIVKSGVIFILVNFLLAVFNLVIGLISGSIAISSDAVHSLIDAISGFIIVGCERLLKYGKFSKSRKKIERIATSIIAMIIIAAGVHISVESVEKIITPDEVEYSIWTVVVLVGSIAAKLWLALYLKNNGKKYDSDVLTASSAETFNDMLISVAVFISILIYMLFKVDIEAYISLGVALIIFKIGFEFLFPDMSHHHHHPLESDHSHGAKI
ncbi:cation diffusion facilitator family transporter [Candidatus Saccharibacteria bacterium]|nr:cation diffusion facilitator family transporter [Candidatus Saccharibacteria bacterium]